MDKKAGVCLHNEILFGYKKEGNLTLWDNMGGLQIIMLSEISQSEKDPPM